MVGGGAAGGPSYGWVGLYWTGDPTLSTRGSTPDGPLVQGVSEMLGSDDLRLALRTPSPPTLSGNVLWDAGCRYAGGFGPRGRPSRELPRPASRDVPGDRNLVLSWYFRSPGPTDGQAWGRDGAVSGPCGTVHRALRQDVSVGPEYVSPRTWTGDDGFGRGGPGEVFGAGGGTPRDPWDRTKGSPQTWTSGEWADPGVQTRVAAAERLRRRPDSRARDPGTSPDSGPGHRTMD